MTPARERSNLDRAVGDALAPTMTSREGPNATWLPGDG